MAKSEEMNRRTFLTLVTGAVAATAAELVFGSNQISAVTARQSSEPTVTPTSTLPDQLATEAATVNPESPFGPDPILFADFKKIPDGTLIKDIPGTPLKVVVRDKKNGTEEITTTDPKNVRIEGGNLVIQADVPQDPAAEITSGEVISSENFKYGRMVVRAKLAGGAGSFSAIWLQSSALKSDAALVQSGDPKSYLVHGELDPAEHQGADPTRISGTTWTHDTKDSAYQLVPDAETTFHDYEVQWTPSYIAFLVDGREFFRKVKPADATELTWPFDDHLFHLVMNLAVGGNWAASFAEKLGLPADGVDRKVALRQMLVESVAVYPYQDPTLATQVATPVATFAVTP